MEYFKLKLQLKILEQLHIHWHRRLNLRSFQLARNSGRFQSFSIQYWESTWTWTSTTASIP